MDLIDRQAAITALVFSDDTGGMTCEQMAKVLYVIKAIPSVQPVITCDGCRHVGTYDTDFPCCSCIRKEKDYYDPE